MANKNQKTKIRSKIISQSATVNVVTLVENGVKMIFEATCEDPKYGGTGNDWKVDIRALASDKGQDDLYDFFESHEMLDILRYDLQDWCRENLSISWDEVEKMHEQAHQENVDRLLDSYLY